MMLLKQTWKYLPAQIVAPAVQFVSVLVWAHILPVEEVGRLTLFVAAQDIMFSGVFMWWSHFMLRYLPRFTMEGGRRDFLAAELFSVTVSSCVTIILSFVLCRFYFGVEMASSLTLSATAFIFVRSLATYFSERARSETRIFLYTALQALFPTVGLVISVVVSLWVAPRADYVLISLAGPQLLGVVIAVAIVDFGRRLAFPDRELLGRALSFGLPITVGSLMGVVALNAPRFIIDQMLGIAAAGMFAVSYGLGIRASSFAVMLVTAGAYPLAVQKMEREGLEAAYKQLSANMILVALTVSPVACGLIGINTSVIDSFLPESMHEIAYILLPLSTLCGLFRYLRSHTTDQVFLIRSKPRLVTMIAAADLLLATTLTVVGLHQFGLWGAVLGPLITAVLTWVTSLVIARTHFAFPFPSWAIFRIVLAAVSMMIVVLEMPVTTSILLLAAEVGAGALIYIALLLLFFPATFKSYLQKFIKGQSLKGVNV